MGAVFEEVAAEDGGIAPRSAPLTRQAGPASIVEECYRRALALDSAHASALWRLAMWLAL